MRILLTIVILAGLAWSGWWFYGAQARETALDDWLAARRADGWLAEAQDIRVTGFPNRLDTIVTGLDLADPASGWAWQADEFQILSLSYKPHHFIAVWPGEQRVGTPQGAIEVTSGLMRGSVVFAPNARLTLDRATIEIEEMTLSATSGWEASIGSAIVAARRAEEGAPEFSYDLGIDASDAVLPALGVGRHDLTEILSRGIRSAGLDATLTFDRSLDRASVEGENPNLLAARLRDLSLDWGRLDLRGQGRIAADADGRAEGEINLRARNWREMIDIAEASDALSGAAAGALRTGLALLATLGGDGNSLQVPLVFGDGDARLGPVRIGAAPRLIRER